MPEPEGGQNPAWSFEDAQAEFKPNTIEAKVCFDGELVLLIERLEAEVLEAQVIDERENRRAEAPALARRVVELTEQLRAKERTFVLQSIGGKPWHDLMDQHPPTAKQREEDALDHNPETFPQDAIAASCVMPKLTVAQVDWMRDNLSLGQFQRIWRACLSVNVGPDGVGKAVAATVARLATGPSWTTADPEASPAASSSDE